MGDNRLLEINNLGYASSVLSQFSYHYNALSRVSQWTSETGAITPTVHKYEYDNEGELLNDLIAPVGQSPNEAYTFAYDGAGNCTNEEVDVTSPSALTTVTSAAYNEINELSGKSGSGPLAVRFEGNLNKAGTATVAGQPATISVATATNEVRTFDGFANLGTGQQSNTVAATDLSGNFASRQYSLKVAGGAAKLYGYDNNGNTLVSGNSIYTWDGENRLATIAIGTNTTVFTYDGFSRRVQIQEYGGSSLLSTKRFVWMGSRLAQELGGNNSLTKQFFGGGEIISGAKYFFTRDHLGSIRTMTDAGENTVAQYDYDAYGNQIPGAVSVNADFGYAGYYVHARSGLYRTWFRAYDSNSGRWLNRDPVGERAGINLYSYVKNSPISQLDPMGLWQLTIGGGALLGIAATLGNNGGTGFLNGQWNVGAYAGLGEGIFGSLDLNNSGVKEEGFQGSLKGEGELEAGSGIDGEFDIRGIGDISENEWGLSANIGLPGLKDADLGFGLLGEGDNAPQLQTPNLGLGAGMYIGVGYDYHGNSCPSATISPGPTPNAQYGGSSIPFSVP